MVPPGGDFLYKFKVDAPGHLLVPPARPTKSTNQVFSRDVRDDRRHRSQRGRAPASGTLPPAAQTKPIVLSDTTVCKTPGSNDTATYASTLPWVGRRRAAGSGATRAEDLCEKAPAGTAIDQDGNPATSDYAAGDIPAIQHIGGGADERGPDRAHQRQERRRARGQPVVARRARSGRLDAQRTSGSRAAARDGQRVDDPLHAPAAHHPDRDAGAADQGGRRGRPARQRGRGGRHAPGLQHWIRPGRNPAAARFARRRGGRDPVVADHWRADDVDRGLSAHGAWASATSRPSP